jgi:hypothetical protein
MKGYMTIFRSAKDTVDESKKPFRIMAVASKKDYAQLLLRNCLGSANTSRLARGKSVASDMLTIRKPKQSRVARSRTYCQHRLCEFL